MRRCIPASLLLLAACADPPPPETGAGLEEAEQVEDVQVTRWTDVSELFVEFIPLQVGRASPFAIHLTDLRSFQPVEEGRVTVRLDHGGGLAEEFTASAPSRPGIYLIDVTPSRQGAPALSILVRSPDLEDTHHLRPVTVLDARKGPSGPPGAPPAEPEGPMITFLKEQQWTLDFATEAVALRTMRPSRLVPAVIEPRTGGRVSVTAPVGGRLLPGVRLPSPGTAVRRNDEVAAIVPQSVRALDRSELRLRLDEARIAVQSAERERARAQRLLEAGAVPARRLHEAEALEALALARRRAAEDRLKHYEATRRDDPHEASLPVFSIRTHLDGTVTSVSATDGAHVEEGETLLEVAAADFVHVSGLVPESQSAVLRTLRGAEIEMPGSGTALPAQRLVATSQVVDPATRTLAATFLFDNRGARLAIGQAVGLRLFTGESVEAPSVPSSALVEDGGRTLAYVQIAGESFESRSVTPGTRQGTAVQVPSGLRLGERVVTRGTHSLRLASMSTEAPAHGHVH